MAASRWPAFALLFTSVARHVLCNEATPVGKVVELLNELKKELANDQEVDGGSYTEYVKWYHNESSTASKVVADTKQTISDLKASLDEQQAFRAGKQQALEKEANELASNEKDMADEEAVRKRERATFEKEEVKLMEGVDSLSHALALLEQGAPMEGMAAGASLLSVAKTLKQTLEQNPDFALTAMQRQTINGFYRTVAEGNSRAMPRRVEAPDFLQVQAKTSSKMKSRGPHGEYEAQAGSIVPLLHDTLVKNEDQLEASRKKEARAANEFSSYKASLVRQIENNQNTISETKAGISRSEERTGQEKAQLLAAEELLKVTEEQLEMVEAQFNQKTAQYRERVALRSDEQLAVDETIRILSSEMAQRVLPKELGSPVMQHQPAADNSFIEVDHTTRRKAIHILRHTLTPGVALLALRTQTHALLGSRDPFSKVKTMLRGLIQKLVDEQAQAATHHEWCESEMGKSTKSEHQKSEDIRKLSDRISEGDAELTSLNEDIATVTRDLAEMKAASSAAAKVRQEERQLRLNAINQYKEAQTLLKTAIKVLKKFYEGRKADAKKAKYAKSGYGAGIIGLLEIAINNFADLQKEAELTEETAQSDFKTLMNENDIRQAVFAKDLEFKSRNKVKLEGDKMRANSDLQSYQKELDAVTTYLDKLKSSCIGKAESYDERKMRRDSELKSLQEALAFLTGEGLGP